MCFSGWMNLIVRPSSLWQKSSPNLKEKQRSDNVGKSFVKFVKL